MRPLLRGSPDKGFPERLSYNPKPWTPSYRGDICSGLRFQDDQGEWGTPAYQTFTTPVPGSSLVAGEYFLNSDPGEGNATSFEVPESGTFSGELNLPPGILSTLPNGTHILGVRLKDNSGQWGVPAYRIFTTPLTGGSPVAEIRWKVSQDGMEILSGTWTEDARAVVRTTRRLLVPGAVVDQKVGIELIPVDAFGVPGIPTLHEMDYRTFQNDFLNQHFTLAEQADPNTSGDSADPDEDGFSNRVERALGLNPRLPSDTTDGLTISSENFSLEFPVGAGAAVPTDGGFLELGDLRFSLMVE